MTPERYEKIREVFAAVSNLPPESRGAYLDSACANDPELKCEVVSLLENDSAAHTFLETPVLGGAAPAAHPEQAAESVPEQLGRYRIVRQLGAGGMGIVYEAKQDRPERSVALKVIKAHLATPDMLRRFDLEAEVLGRLQHPGIAQIYDAGTAETPHGQQPWFAMELVKGRSLVQHAEEQGLNLVARLEIIVRLCEAVQHAHQHGIIHRDLKPANILVSGRAPDWQPRILDFGVARVTDVDLKATVETGVGQLVGTLGYMSPEQLSGQPSEVDTRSDVWALGVICFELLSGRLPHATEDRTLPETIRIISEEEPAVLSTVDPAFRGDIATLVGKALERDKHRRYQTASALAADIRRFLNDEPITARPPTTIYTLQKFTRRNKGLVAGLALAAIALIVGIIGTSWQAIVATRQREDATEQRDIARTEARKADAALKFVETMFTVNPDIDGRAVTVFEMLPKSLVRAEAELADDPEVHSVVRSTIARTYSALGQYPEAREQFERTLEIDLSFYGEDHAMTAASRANLARVLNSMSEYAEAERLYKAALPVLKRDLGEHHVDYLVPFNALGLCLQNQGRHEEAEFYLRGSVDLCKAIYGSSHTMTLSALNNLSGLMLSESRMADAEAILREIVEIEQADGIENTQAFIHIDNLAHVVGIMGDHAQAEQLHRRALAGLSRLLGEEHPTTLVAIRNLAHGLYERGRMAEAVELAEKCIAIERRTQGENERLATALTDLAKYLRRVQRFDDAKAAIEEAIQLQLKINGPRHRQTISARGSLANLLVEMGRRDDALRELSEIQAVVKAMGGPTDLWLLMPLNSYARLLGDKGRFEEAEAIFQEILASAGQFLPADHWRLAMMRGHYGKMLGQARRFEEGEPLLLSAYDVMRDKLGESNLFTRVVVRDLASFYEACNVPDKAEAWRERIADP